MSLVNVKCILCLGEIEKDHKLNLIYSKKKTTFDITLPLLIWISVTLCHLYTVLKYIWATHGLLYFAKRNDTKPNQTRFQRQFYMNDSYHFLLTQTPWKIISIKWTKWVEMKKFRGSCNSKQETIIIIHVELRWKSQSFFKGFEFSRTRKTQDSFF